MTDRELINKALWLHPPTTEKGKVVGELVDLCERLLAGRNKPAPDAEPALRREIDDGPAVSLLLWADLLEEKGEDASVCEKLRYLAREGKWPGRVGGLYRWSPERPEFGGGSSWTLPENVTFTIARHFVHLGGKEKGRFTTPSAALLAAARVLAGKDEPVAATPPHKALVGHCPVCEYSVEAVEIEVEDCGACMGCPTCEYLFNRQELLSLDLGQIGHLSGDFPTPGGLR